MSARSKCAPVAVATSARGNWRPAVVVLAAVQEGLDSLFMTLCEPRRHLKVASRSVV